VLSCTLICAMIILPIENPDVPAQTGKGERS